MNQLITLLFILTSAIVLAQEPITLQQCLELAKSHDQQLITEKSKVEKSVLDQTFHKWSLLPDLSSNIGFNTYFGRRLDPITNTFATKSVNSQSFGLSSNLVLFSGGKYFYQKQLYDLAIRQNTLSYEAKENERTIQLIESYTELCKLSIQLKLSESRIENYLELQEVQRLLVREGKINSIDTLRTHNSVLNEQLLIENLRNNFNLSSIEFNYQLGVPLNSRYAFIESSISAISPKPVFSETFTIASIDNNLLIQNEQFKMETSNLLPRLSLVGTMGTGFSTNNKDTLPGNPTLPFDYQFNKNINEGIGFYLSIPIFSKGTWLKARKMNAIVQHEMTLTKDQAMLALEKRRLETEQEILAQKTQIILQEKSASNFEIIYNKSLLLYQEGRMSYMEIETAFLEWQVKMVEVETLKLNLQKSLLFR